MAVDHDPVPADLEQLGPPISEEEYYALDVDDSYELLGGRLVEVPSWSLRHADLFGFMLTLTSLYLDERGGARVLGSRLAMRLDPVWSPEPDLVVVREEHRDRFTERRLEGPADWAIEILSSTGMRIESRIKLPRYREAGIPEIWLIDPFAETVRTELRQADGTYAVATHSTGRIASATLPGFWIDAAWLTRDPLPATLACLREILGDRETRPSI